MLDSQRDLRGGLLAGLTEGFGVGSELAGLTEGFEVGSELAGLTEGFEGGLRACWTNRGMRWAPSLVGSELAGLTEGFAQACWTNRACWAAGSPGLTEDLRWAPSLLD